MRAFLAAVVGLALLTAPAIASAHPRFGYGRGWGGGYGHPVYSGWRPGVVAPPVFYPPGVGVGPAYWHGHFHRHGWR
jgi:hypothetical protein